MQEASWKRGQAGRADSLNENFSVCSQYATPLGASSSGQVQGQHRQLRVPLTGVPCDEVCS